MLFADEIVLIDETRGGVNEKLEVWLHTLESKGFDLSKSKTKYLECRFSDLTEEADIDVRLDSQVIPSEEVSSILGLKSKGMGRLARMSHIALEQGG